MFGTFNAALLNVGIGLATLGGGAAALSVAILALMNMWGILDPRMGQAVKGGLLRVILSGVLLGAVGSVAAIMASLGAPVTAAP